MLVYLFHEEKDKRHTQLHLGSCGNSQFPLLMLLHAWTTCSRTSPDWTIVVKGLTGLGATHRFMALCALVSCQCIIA
jgi:hypothetical protein